MTDQTRSRVILGVAGGIAAYKACELLRRLTESGHDVRVIPTESALKFVGAATWAALSGNPVSAEVWDDVHLVPHVRLGQSADLIVVAPATADLLARTATGRADDLLAATLLTARCPILLAPAMHTEMWEHPATQANVATLRSRGVIVLDPASGRLTGADTGPGRLPEPSEIAAAVLGLLAEPNLTADLAGRHVLVTAGGTREPIDPVRFIGNRSSGKQGYALARAAALRGADVTVISANVDLPDPAGAKVIRVGSAAQLSDESLAAAGGADVILMAAAVADFRPASAADHKLKKGIDELTELRLVRTDDVLVELSANRRRVGQVIVGFGAETHNVIHAGRVKLAAKGCDLLVVNQVGEALAFGTDTNAATVLFRDGSATEIPMTDKDALAHRVLDAVVHTISALSP